MLFKRVYFLNNSRIKPNSNEAPERMYNEKAIEVISISQPINKKDIARNELLKKLCIDINVALCFEFMCIL